MAITTYAELQLAVADLLNRSDLTAVIPTWVDLVEAECGRVLKGRNMRTSLAVTFDTSGALTLPSDFVRANSLTLETDLYQWPVAVKPYEYVIQKRQQLVNGPTRYAAVLNNQLVFAPLADSDTAYTGTLVYDQALAALSDTQTSNWLLANHPDVYLYGCAFHSATYLKDDERIGLWDKLYHAGLDQIRVLRDESEYASMNTPIARPVSALGE